MRRNAEGHMGALVLSSARRPKSYYRGAACKLTAAAGIWGAGSQRDAVPVEPAGLRRAARLESAPVARAGAAGGQPSGPPWAAADIRHRPHAAAHWMRLWSKLTALDWASG